MAVPSRIPVRFEDVFPHGGFVLGVEAANDFDKVKANAPDVQARDKDTGARVWSVRVLDADPAARTAELKVKILGRRRRPCRTFCREPRCARRSPRGWPWCPT